MVVVCSGGEMGGSGRAVNGSHNSSQVCDSVLLSVALAAACHCVTISLDRRTHTHTHTHARTHTLVSCCPL